LDEEIEPEGISVEYSKLSASELYAAFIPVVMNDKVVILDIKKLNLQLANLERRTGEGGKEKIDHPSGSHDDCAVVCAGACFLANYGERGSFFAAVVGSPIYGPGSDEGPGGYTSFDDWANRSKYPK